MEPHQDIKEAFEREGCITCSGTGYIFVPIGSSPEDMSADTDVCGDCEGAGLVKTFSLQELSDKLKREHRQMEINKALRGWSESIGGK